MRESSRSQILLLVITLNRATHGRAWDLWNFVQGAGESLVSDGLGGTAKGQTSFVTDLLLNPLKLISGFHLFKLQHPTSSQCIDDEHCRVWG